MITRTMGSWTSTVVKIVLITMIKNNICLATVVVNMN